MIKRYQIDITGDYNTWFTIANSIVTEFGESGREYFHAISRYYEKYNFNEADRKYTHALKAGGNRAGLKYIFSRAKDYGLLIYSKQA